MVVGLFDLLCDSLGLCYYRFGARGGRMSG